jgi:hypothetical protein
MHQMVISTLSCTRTPQLPGCCDKYSLSKRCSHRGCSLKLRARKCLHIMSAYASALVINQYVHRGIYRGIQG